MLSSIKSIKLVTFLGITLLSMLSSIAVFAQPIVTDTSGPLSHGETITIAGSTFGQKNQAVPWRWDPIEGVSEYGGLSDGDIIPYSPGGYWDKNSASRYKYTTDQGIQRGVSTANACTGTSSSLDIKLGTTLPDTAFDNETYVSFWIWHSTTLTSSDNTKTIRYWESPSGILRFSVQDSWTANGPWNAHRYDSGSYCYDSGVFPGNFVRPIAGEWERVEMYLKQETTPPSSDDADIWIAQTANGKISTYSKVNFNDTCNGATARLRWLTIGYDNNVAKTMAIALDDIYIDNTKARVEIGNTPAWDTCTHREIQIPSKWSDTSITITANQGSFSGGENVYLFVVDADGNPSAGFGPITIASGSGEDTTAPITSGHSPSKNASDIARNTNIVVHVSDSGDGVDESSIVMTVKGSPVSPTISGTAANYTLTYDPPSDFSPGQVVNVSIDAEDLHSPANVMATDTYSFTIQLEPDIVDPTVFITQPTSEDTYSTNQHTITLGGTASDNVGITSVTWENDQGGNGTASGTTSWTISNVSLQEGDSVITITAHDAAGNTNTDTLTVTYTPPPGTYTEEFGSATGTDYPGTLQDTFININEENSASSQSLNSYTWPANQVANAIIMKGNLAAIPEGASIGSANLYLYMTEEGGDAQYDISVHKIINHNPDLSQCTGYTYDGTNGWTPNNQCYNNIPLAQADIADAEDVKPIDTTSGYKTWNVTNMVREWINNPSANFGLLVNSDSSASNDSYRTFASSEASDPNQRPKLVVTYTVGGDTTAPGDVSGFTATSCPGQITLTWTNPTDTDFSGVMIRYRTDGTNPQNKYDGSPIPNGNDGKIAGSPGQNMSYVHTNLDSATHYYYSAFSYDISNNYSQAAYADAQPLPPSNQAPVIGEFKAIPSSLNNPGETTTLNVSATDPDGDSLTYTINFGDGTASQSGSEAVHTYETKGTYTADVTVDDGHGNIVGESLQIAVNDVPPAKPTSVTVK